MKRPVPPERLLTPGRTVEPAPKLEAWLRETFVDEGGKLENPAHLHLRHARIGVLWTNVGYRRRGATVAGMAEIPIPRDGNAWQKARALAQLDAWFGGMPDFLLTFSAPIVADYDHTSFCALVEHELYHCAQARGRFGAPKFSRTGRPVFALAGHDVEAFVGEVERYGAGAAAGRTADLVAAGKRKPTVARAAILAACGTGLRRAA